MRTHKNYTMFSSPKNNGNAVVWVLIAVIAIFVIGFIVWAAQTENDLFNNNDVTAVQSIEFDEDMVVDQDGNTLVSVEDFPTEIDVSPESAFGGADRITDASLSPDRDWIAITTGGAAHQFGWIYGVESRNLSAVAFQFGGGVDIQGWNEEGRFVAFRRTTPAPSTLFKIVDVEDIGDFPSTTGFVVEVPEELDLIPEEADFENVEWDNDRFCFDVNGQGFCADAVTGEVMGRENA